MAADTMVIASQVFKILLHIYNFTYINPNVSLSEMACEVNLLKHMSNTHPKRDWTALTLIAASESKPQLASCDQNVQKRKCTVQKVSTDHP